MADPWPEVTVRRAGMGTRSAGSGGMRISRALSVLTLIAMTGSFEVPGLAQEASGVDVVEIRVAVVLDAGERAVEVTQATVFEATAPVHRIRFMPLQFSSATFEIDGRDVPFVRSGDSIELTLNEPLKPGVRVTLLSDMRVPEPTGIRFGDDVTYSDFHTCTWMLCTDDVSDRAMVELRVQAPGLRTVGSGELVERETLGSGVQSSRWRSRIPVAPFLVGFAAVPHSPHVVEAGDVTLEFLAADTDTDPAVRALAESRSMIEFLEEITGVPFPARRYVQVVVTGFEAQEKEGLALIGAGWLEHFRKDPREDWVFAHEMAHQYWGVLLPITDWSELWLNEGFAVFMVAVWKERRWGRDAYAREMELAAGRLEKARETGFDRPLTWAGAWPDLRTRRAITYSKGALFLDHLRRVMGEAAFWNGLAGYVREGRGDPVTTRDFQKAMERASGRSLASEFDLWAYESDAPR